MHESLYAAVGKRLTYVLNVAARAMTKQALNVHAGHDDYHAVDDTGFFQLFAKDVQEAADLNLIAHRIAELSLNPGLCAQDGFLTSHVIESVRLPERDLVREYLGDPSDIIESPTPSQRMMFGEQRRRIPEMFDVDHPAILGSVQNQDSYAQGVAAQRPFFFDHVASLSDRAFAEYAELTGRRYARATGYRLDDADYAIVGQGSVVSNAEVVCDWLRKERKLRIGVLNLTMFRPFPADLVSALLKGKKAVLVLERTDQPLAVDLPVLREIRATMAQAMENGRAPAGATPFAGLASLNAADVPDFYSGCFGLGSRDLQAGDIIGAVENMLPAGPRAAGAQSTAAHKRRFYLGIDFIRKGTLLPKLQIWQEQVSDSYPHLGDLTLPAPADVNLLPENSVSVRIHSVGGWGAITMGKNLSSTVFELFGLHVKANPKYGSEKKGQPTTFYATFAHEPIRLNCELKHVDVVLSPDPNVFRNSDPLAGLAPGGVFIIQSDLAPDALWESLPASARRIIVDRGIKVFTLDAFKIANEEASDPELRFRMQGAAFLGAFFAASPLLSREGKTEAQLFEGIEKQLTKKFSRLGARVVSDNVRVIGRGYADARAVPHGAVPDDVTAERTVPELPRRLDAPNAEPGFANTGRFWEQVCVTCKTGQDPIADPFAALSAIPAATSVVRDMTDVRFELPEFIPENCTGCAQCWTQCPDAAIPALVSDVEDLLAAAVAEAANGQPLERMRQLLKPLAKETRRLIKAGPMPHFGETLSAAYANTVEKLKLEAKPRAVLDAEFARVHQLLATFPLAKTGPFFDNPERKLAGSGGLLSIVINPEACKGCNLCVEVCPDKALVTVKQDDANVARLRRDWSLWQRLPDTDDRFVNVTSVDEGIGVLPMLLLKKQSYRSMAGGDGSCMGCGEKTAVHLVLSAIHAMMEPRVKRHVAELDSLIAQLDNLARTLVAADADLEAASRGAVEIALDVPQRRRLDAITRTLRELKDLRWRYVEGPTGQGRAMLGMSNSTGCSSVWGSTYPYNPYPFPWVNHLFQDAPSVAIGVFEGHMRKMGNGFAAVRRAKLVVADTYDAATHDAEFAGLSWKDFTDDEFHLCPPIVAMGGDGAMLDIGFQNLSRLMASDKPIRVIVLDTQVYSNTGGQACTSGYTGQVADMSAYGKAQHGKTEMRKELGFIALAHRGVFVHQSSQASPSHLLGGVLKGLQGRRPAVFNLYTPCPVEHGLADEVAMRAARLALESRAFPFMTYDPDAGTTFAERLSLEGNPSLDTPWPVYRLQYVNDEGVAAEMELPLTIADWAATEGRFKKHFSKLGADVADTVPFHEFLLLDAADREGKVPFVYAVNAEKRLTRLQVSVEIATLAAERLSFWSELKQLAGLEIPAEVREQATARLEAEYQQKLAALTVEHAAAMTALRASYPPRIARRMAEALLNAADGGGSLKDLLATLPAVTARPPSPNGDEGAASAAGAAATAAATKSPPPQARASTPAAETPATAAGQDGGDSDVLTMEAYIESERCTTCDECTNLNSRMFAYNAAKQAFIKDVHAGTFQQMVLAAERCPVTIIHPGSPLNPAEKNLEKWVKRAERFA
jgi:pyruvate-ferredoxin/flavodoxin oxidoreductase